MRVDHLEEVSRLCVSVWKLVLVVYAQVTPRVCARVVQRCFSGPAFATIMTLSHLVCAFAGLTAMWLARTHFMVYVSGQTSWGLWVGAWRCMLTSCSLGAFGCIFSTCAWQIMCVPSLGLMYMRQK